MKSLALVAFSVAITPLIIAQTPTRRAQLECHFHGCQSYQQLASANDPDIRMSDVACFYEGENPASKEKGAATNDEFLLLMEGAKSKTKSGVHPGVFVSRVADGQPENYSGYGPEHGGLEAADSMDKSQVWVTTYDDLGDAIRFARFFFGPKAIWSGGDFKTTKENFLRNYEEIVIRKSTGRFVQKITDFDSRPVGDVPNADLGPFYTTYKGQCFGTKGPLLKSGIPSSFK